MLFTCRIDPYCYRLEPQCQHESTSGPASTMTATSASWGFSQRLAYYLGPAAHFVYFAAVALRDHASPLLISVHNRGGEVGRICTSNARDKSICIDCPRAVVQQISAHQSRTFESTTQRQNHTLLSALEQSKIQTPHLYSYFSLDAHPLDQLQRSSQDSCRNPSSRRLSSLSL